MALLHCTVLCVSYACLCACDASLMKVPPLFKTNSFTNGVASLRRGSWYCMGEQWIGLQSLYSWGLSLVNMCALRHPLCLKEAVVWLWGVGGVRLPLTKAWVFILTEYKLLPHHSNPAFILCTTSFGHIVLLVPLAVQKAMARNRFGKLPFVRKF